MVSALLGLALGVCLWLPLALAFGACSFGQPMTCVRLDLLPWALHMAMLTSVPVMAALRLNQLGPWMLACLQKRLPFLALLFLWCHSPFSLSLCLSSSPFSPAHQQLKATEAVLREVVLGTVIGAWLGALPIPLDWGQPWQQWPDCSINGALFGFALATFLATRLL